eukprot:GHVL01040679.1.p1 GENE.GHVL01040679.1~~GHVL01040679.1.p1  ORF type:complete len:440 (+),score=141.64 GHVL01040679.1:38-1357(+)
MNKIFFLIFIFIFDLYKCSYYEITKKKIKNLKNKKIGLLTVIGPTQLTCLIEDCMKYEKNIICINIDKYIKNSIKIATSSSGVLYIIPYDELFYNNYLSNINIIYKNKLKKNIIFQNGSIIIIISNYIGDENEKKKIKNYIKKKIFKIIPVNVNVTVECIPHGVQNSEKFSNFISKIEDIKKIEKLAAEEYLKRFQECNREDGILKTDEDEWVNDEWTCLSARKYALERLKNDLRELGNSILIFGTFQNSTQEIIDNAMNLYDKAVTDDKVKSAERARQRELLEDDIERTMKPIIDHLLKTLTIKAETEYFPSLVTVSTPGGDGNPTKYIEKNLQLAVSETNLWFLRNIKILKLKKKYITKYQKELIEKLRDKCRKILIECRLKGLMGPAPTLRSPITVSLHYLSKLADPKHEGCLKLGELQHTSADPRLPSSFRTTVI